ncbi:unnamed protein product [Didymodactylos carnosus]|uniref:Coiled-coil domain-containing protein 181 n=1 Tax=Didymodactylos carnosus TaxID=1234261 RepID=A0A814GYA5_9BILA|nr:unnamed protein product [Didymodactylos carnosus]CAF1002575.1 unnamed protein product [Didymodactylos carnosus]CAF3538335.1 unnamed protein product [Didymodactylos carnosus]CAF3773993.1 unnamed protein product [Didymodactylos carnosus]
MTTTVDRPNQFSSYDRTPFRNNYSSFSDSSAAQTRRLQGTSTLPRPGQHLDDADLLTWKRQYANIGLREQNMLSNSAEDLSQLDRIPFQYGIYGNEYNDMDTNMDDDDDLHFGIEHNYDYEAVIKDRLKKVNAEFEHDQTPAELNHRQRVSFDAVVKAVDIVHDDAEEDGYEVQKGSSVTDQEEDKNTDSDLYTVPLNDTQPKSGPSLLQQLKAMQFHGALPIERFSPRNSKDETQQTFVPSNTKNENENENDEIEDLTDSSAKKTLTTLNNESNSNQMVVAINGVFDLKNEDDYLAKKNLTKEEQPQNSKQVKVPSSKVSFESTESTTNLNQNESKRIHTLSPIKRPKSSDITSSKNRTITESKPGSRPKSANITKSTDNLYPNKTSSGVNFAELNRVFVEKKKQQQKEELRREREAEEKREKDRLKAKQSFERWSKDKDTEKKRLEEERRKKLQEEQAQKSKEDAEKEEKIAINRKKWEERKRQQTLSENELKKLREEEELEDLRKTGTGHRAFHRWLRQKYEQSLEEKRQLRLEARRLRRRQKKSLKRYRLDQDLQLAKSFGYS